MLNVEWKKERAQIWGIQQQNSFAHSFFVSWLFSVVSTIEAIPERQFNTVRVASCSKRNISQWSKIMFTLFCRVLLCSLLLRKEREKGLTIVTVKFFNKIYNAIVFLLSQHRADSVGQANNCISAVKHMFCYGFLLFH